MQIKTIQETVMGYLIYLEDQGITAIKSDDLTVLANPDRKEELLAHVAWMCTMMQEFGDSGKLNRWLGFIQGVLWSTGQFPIERFKNDNTQDLYN